MNWIESLIGELRLFWGFCPQCNSDAPFLYDCPVCEYYHGPFPPPKELKKEWWEKFKKKIK